MKLTQILKDKKPKISFEVFPPKDNISQKKIFEAASEIAKLHPSYMSVTYGAGGGTSDYTVELAARLKETVPMLTHLSCVNSTRRGVISQLNSMKEEGLDNVLALRGDITPDMKLDPDRDYHYAGELVKDIRKSGNFCIGGACYPEGHPESKNQKEDILHVKEKVEAGCDFLVTQMFFDNNIFYNYLYKIREAGIMVPVIPGIMPLTNAKQTKRIMSLSGTLFPRRFVQIVDYFGETPATMKQAGIIYATEQIIDLFANGITSVHIYSMNRPDVASAIMNNLSEILV